MGQSVERAAKRPLSNSLDWKLEGRCARDFVHVQKDVGGGSRALRCLFLALTPPTFSHLLFTLCAGTVLASASSPAVSCPSWPGALALPFFRAYPEAFFITLHTGTTLVSASSLEASYALPDCSAPSSLRSQLPHSHTLCSHFRRNYARQCLITRGLMPFLAAPFPDGDALLEDGLVAASRMGLVRRADRSSSTSHRLFWCIVQSWQQYQW